MTSLTTSTAPAYLASRGIDTSGLHVKPLGGGVSNEVLLCEWTASPETAQRVVIKQALGKLRVREEWLADPSRIQREWSAVDLASKLMPPGSVPEVLWTDSDNGIFAMSAAPFGVHPWKELLLADWHAALGLGVHGVTARGVAEKAAAMLGAWIAKSWQNEELARQFGDKTAFDQLRLDPYYRFTATRHPAIAGWLHALVDRSLSANLSLVHGDWSPKNILVGDSVWAIDFEVVHFGDPAFDVAFLLNHLLLKWVHRGMTVGWILDEAHTFTRELSRHLPAQWPTIQESTLLHLPALMLARVDGKSPAEYLSADERPFVRARALEWVARHPASLEAAIDEASRWRF